METTEPVQRHRHHHGRGRDRELFATLGRPGAAEVFGQRLAAGVLQSQHGQSQPAVSHHLNQLRVAGLIDYRRSGKFNFYALNPAGLHPLYESLVPDGGPTKLALSGVEVGVRRK